MDPIANPTVQVQDGMTTSDGRPYAEPDEIWDGLRRTVSKMTGRSKTGSEAKQSIHQEMEIRSHGRTRSHRTQPIDELDEEPGIPIVDAEDDFPEGGLRAWLVVASACLMLFPSFGFMVSIGTLQDYWGQHQLSYMSARDIGWIPSVFVYLSLALGIWVGPLFDRYGPRWIALTGSVMFLLMIFLLAECDKFWQMILCCGVLGGFSGAMLTTTSLAVVAHWFKARRGLTQGIAMMGSSAGGLAIPLILRTTLPKYGYAWSLRILGFVFLFCFIVANILMKARIPPSAAAKKKAIISLSIYGDLRLSLFTLSVFGFEVVLFGGLGIMPTYASISTDFPPDTGFYLIAVLNGVSCLGRLFPGYVADKIGRFNTLFVMILFTLLWMLVLWLPFGTTSLPALYAFAALFGFGLLLAYIVVGSVLWCVMQSVAELATVIPTAGSFPHFASRFIDPAVGFSLAISYGYCYTISIAAECSASAILVGYWTDMSPAIVITISLVLILAINLLSVRWFGESEVAAGTIKIACFLGLILVSIVITSGGAPNGETIGFRYWNNPGAWVDYNGITGPTGHFLGFLASFVNAAFSFIGVEVVVITAAESINPHVAIPKSAKRVTFRIALFYVLGALLIGIIVDPRNPGLVSDSGNANSSPWVIAIKQAGISTLPSIVNACILISAWSAGNSYCWVGSRIIVAMTTDRQLPQFFGRTWSNGVPYWAVLASWAFGPLAYLSLGSGGAAQAFGWLVSLSTVAGLIAWATLCFCFIRFYAAMKAQGHSRDSLPWKSPFQPFTAWYGFIGSTIITLITGFPVFLKGNWNTGDFIASYIGIPLFIVPIIVWKLWHKTQFARAKTIDLHSGRLR
ncbi:hypothetical protein J4E82_008737 [Alternaria postmessia]|nr:uncharacterized protein J4E82_008737 [Alternaria postmessia]KAI5372541.1 hypothetical protein J4E82_008737 [Alternaria postmessia]